MHYTTEDPCDGHDCPENAYPWSPIGPVTAEATQSSDRRILYVTIRPEDATGYEWNTSLLELAQELLEDNDAAPWGRRYLYVAGKPGTFAAPLLVDMGGTNPREDTDLVAIVAPRVTSEEAQPSNFNLGGADHVIIDNTHTVALFEWPVHVHQGGDA